MNEPGGPVGRQRPRVRFVAALLLLVAVVATFALVAGSLGAPATVGPGTPEVAQGADVGEQTPAYWAWEAAQIWNIPSALPTALSTVARTPTVLAAATSSYRINPSVAGNASVRWEFLETTTAPGSTELELRFTDGLTRPAATITVYLETRPGTLFAALDYFVYWDAGAFGPSGVTVQTMHVVVLVCTSVGICP
jgi:hypothetical protein